MSTKGHNLGEQNFAREVYFNSRMFYKFTRSNKYTIIIC